jgi:hypothetical protein
VLKLVKTCLEPIRFWSRLLRVLLLAQVAVIWTAGVSGTAATFYNDTRILLGGVAAPPGPYPSSINISNVPGTISSLTVTLTNISHPLSDDIDALLVGPNGERVMLMSDTGGTNRLNFVTLRFSDTATANLPDTTAISAGIYRPSNFAVIETAMPSPSPTGPYGSALSIFNGISPNGTWRLYATDDTVNASSGSLGGWFLNMNIVVTPVTIVSEPQDKVVNPGGTAQFAVSVTGTPPFSYQWSRNGQVIVPFGQGGATLNVFNVTSNNAGFYSVEVRNPGTIAAQSRQARLDVTGPLTIVNQPDSITVQPGADVRLYAGVSGTPPIRYQWTLNGVSLRGETNPFLILNKVVVSDGGDYRCTVWNSGDATTTRKTVVVVTGATVPPPRNIFADRPSYEGLSGVTQGNNANANIEPCELILPGGGKTMWFEFIALESGIVTFNSRGSSFDTTLRAFRGTRLCEPLVPITLDDDRGGFYTSLLRFNVSQGEAYQIQIDGFFQRGLGGGPFTVSWSLKKTSDTIPVVITNPERQAVKEGERALFKIELENPDNRIQWLRNGVVLPGETDRVLFIPVAKREHVGRYFALITSINQRFLIQAAEDLSIETEPVTLQVGSIDGFPVEDKREALLFAAGAGAFIPLGLGNAIYQIVPAGGDHDDDDPNPCGNPFFGTLWQGVQATNNGIIQVDTVGSELPARMAVYHITGSASDFSTPAFICDLSSASNGVPAVAQFQGQLGTNYAIVIEGMTNIGNLQLNCKMGIAPPLANSLLQCFVPVGSSLVLKSPATNWCPLPSCQWRRNGVDIPGATNDTLVLTNFSAGMTGTYSIRVSNFVSTATRNVATANLVGPFTVDHWWTTNDFKIGLVLSTSNSMPFVIQTTTNLNSPWLSIATNPDPCLILSVTNTDVLTSPQRFFRAAPWSP